MKKSKKDTSFNYSILVEKSNINQPINQNVINFRFYVYRKQIQYIWLNPRNPLSAVKNPKKKHSMIKLLPCQAQTKHGIYRYRYRYWIQIKKRDTIAYPFWAMWIAETPLINFHPF